MCGFIVSSVAVAVWCSFVICLILLHLQFNSKPCLDELQCVYELFFFAFFVFCSINKTSSGIATATVWGYYNGIAKSRASPLVWLVGRWMSRAAARLACFAAVSAIIIILIPNLEYTDTGHLKYIYCCFVVVERCVCCHCYPFLSGPPLSIRALFIHLVYTLYSGLILEFI